MASSDGIIKSDAHPAATSTTELEEMIMNTTGLSIITKTDTYDNDYRVGTPCSIATTRSFHTALEPDSEDEEERKQVVKEGRGLYIDLSSPKDNDKLAEEEEMTPTVEKEMKLGARPRKQRKEGSTTGSSGSSSRSGSKSRTSGRHSSRAKTGKSTETSPTSVQPHIRSQPPSRRPSTRQISTSPSLRTTASTATSPRASDSTLPPLYIPSNARREQSGSSFLMKRNGHSYHSPQISPTRASTANGSFKSPLSNSRRPSIGSTNSNGLHQLNLLQATSPSLNQSRSMNSLPRSSQDKKERKPRQSVDAVSLHGDEPKAHRQQSWELHPVLAPVEICWNSNRKSKSLPTTSHSKRPFGFGTSKTKSGPTTPKESFWDALRRKLLCFSHNNPAGDSSNKRSFIKRGAVREFVSSPIESGGSSFDSATGPEVRKVEKLKCWDAGSVVRFQVELGDGEEETESDESDDEEEGESSNTVDTVRPAEKKLMVR